MKNVFFTLVISVLLSSCKISGLTNDYSKLTEENKNRIVTFESFVDYNSERIYEISRLFGLGYEVFDSPESFKEWLLTPSKVLSNKKPFELLDSSLGFELVENEIVRIQYNVYS